MTTRKIDDLVNEVSQIKSGHKLLKIYSQNELNWVKNHHQENRLKLIKLKAQAHFKATIFEIDQKICFANKETKKINSALTIHKKKLARQNNPLKRNTLKSKQKNNANNVFLDFEHSKIMEGVFTCKTPQDLYEMFQIKELNFAKTNIMNQRSAFYTEKKLTTTPEERKSIDSRIQFINEICQLIDQAILKLSNYRFSLELL
ncbi:hypothetical protein A7M79_01260 [Acinetobacter baumannii]|uniref:hypothetical protein n=1 Tax=Acinetobacter baumannii TaxID=470 RepID=UPI0008DCED10|nr:hypothetical protein [Acinetobacter baumannii]OIH12144.1 hypothetical protein A7M79_01260 [Acinetobacter baumannii]